MSKHGGSGHPNKAGNPGRRDGEIPTAPYPPIQLDQSMPVSSLKSSMASSPHYTTSTSAYQVNRSLTSPDGSIGSFRNSSRSSLDYGSATEGNAPSNIMDGLEGSISGGISGGVKQQQPQHQASQSLTNFNNNNIANPRSPSAYASRLKLFPYWKDGTTFATINCMSPTYDNRKVAPPTVSNSNRAGQSIPPRKNRKLGPVLVELRKIELAQSPQQHDEYEDKTNHATATGDSSSSVRGHDLFTIKTIAVSRGNPSLGTSVASTCMDVPIIQTYKSTNSKSSLYAATGLTTGALCIHSFDGLDGSSTDDDNESVASSIEYYHMPRHHRQASAVAWRTGHGNHVAIGLFGSSGGNTGQGQSSAGNNLRRANTGIRTGGDREFCCFLWDIEGQHPSSAAKRMATPLMKLSHNAAVSSLAWMMNGQTLAVGGQVRNIQLYDMRMSGSNAPPVSAFAYNFGVHGIQVDPHRPHVMATFCRAVGEPVKIWDMRRMDTVLSEIKIQDLHTTFSASSSAPNTSQTAFVSSLKWSTSYPGTISVAIGNGVYDYDASSNSRPTLTQVCWADSALPIVDFAVYDKTKPKKLTITTSDNKSNKNEPTFDAACDPQLSLSDLFHRRILTVLKDKTVVDMAHHTLAPLAISHRDGRLVNGYGRTIWVGSTDDGPAAMESLQSHEDEDISATMMRRARCLHESKYSMDITANIKMLTKELDEVGIPNRHDVASPHSLLRLWSWIDQIESLSSDSEGADEAQSVWKPSSLLHAGVWELLQFDLDDSPNDDLSTTDSLHCKVYSSASRKAALTACGWAGKFDLNNILGKCETIDEFERSAALAVWHGNLGAAVDALQRGSEASREKAEKSPDASPNSYSEILELIAMCIAGYNGHASESTSKVWRTACSNLLKRNELSLEQANQKQEIAYLRGLCDFLMADGIKNGSQRVLGNERLSLCDRVAFACRFLESKELREYLSKCTGECEAKGDLEGLVITSLSKEGIQIIQSYMDRFADVQTAALVVSRVIIPAEWVVERRKCTEWVESYRGLLNTWQMWQSRSMFDVDRAEILRRIKSDGASTMKTGIAGRRIQPLSRRQQYRLGGEPDFLSMGPAQLDARCNYCSSPLGLRRNEGNRNQWLSKMKPVLSCCPQCRKPLPRCSICLLSLGCLNPYMELTRDRGRTDDLSSLANLPFAEWFTWCLRCKHGGHAHHLVGWFANHEVCPVSGCDCCCQVDGIRKLKRPGLAVPPKVNTIVPKEDTNAAP